MAKSSKYFAVTRQWQILQIIPIRPPGISARKITELLADEAIQVSKRTVERDLNELSLTFSLTSTDQGQGQTKRWYFASGRVPSIGSMDAVDAALIVLAGDVLDQMLPKEAYKGISDRIDKARQKLNNLHESPLFKWKNKVRYLPSGLPYERPDVDPDILRGLQRALIEGKQVEVRYSSLGKSPYTTSLHPLALVLRGSVLYLIATAKDYQEVRNYALHRVVKLKLQEADAIEPVDFSLDSYLENNPIQFESGKKIKLVASISVGLATILQETPVSKDQQIKEMDNGYQLVASLQESWQLNAWILSQCTDLCVLEPKDLRRTIADKLASAAESYK